MRSVLLAAAATLALLTVASDGAVVQVTGVHDLNDGWVHVILPANAVVEAGVFMLVAPDEGDLVLDVETWYVGGVGELPYRLEVGGFDFPHSSLAFSNLQTFAEACVPDLPAPCAEGPSEQATFFSTGRAGIFGVPSDDGKRLSFRIPVAHLAAAQGVEGTDPEPFAVWHHLNYKPRDADARLLYSGGAPSSSRSDHKGADDTACRAGVQPWVNCPASGGFHSAAKNAAFFAGFGEKDPYANEGGDAEGTPYGANDAVVGALGGTSSGLEAELLLKGQLDRQEYTLGAVDA